MERSILILYNLFKDCSAGYLGFCLRGQFILGGNYIEEDSGFFTGLRYGAAGRRILCRSA